MAKIKRTTKIQTLIQKTLHTKLKIEKHEPTKKPWGTRVFWLSKQLLLH